MRAGEGGWGTGAGVGGRLCVCVCVLWVCGKLKEAKLKAATKIFHLQMTSIGRRRCLEASRKKGRASAAEPQALEEYQPVLQTLLFSCAFSFGPC